MRNHTEVTAIKSLGERILTLRAQEDYYQSTVQTLNGQEDVAPPQLVGNLGGICFFSEGKAYGEALVAASAAIKYDLSDYLGEEKIPLVMVNATECGTLFFQSGPDSATTHEPRFQVKRSRTHDSEYILLNAMDCFLQESGKRTGTLYLVTERIPCPSCTDVITRFCRAYDQIPVAIYYLLDTARKTSLDGVRTTVVRKAEDFYNECTLPQVQLNWLALEDDTLHVGKHSRGMAGPIEWVKSGPAE